MMTDLIPSPTLEAARLYLARGWSPIPLAAATKWPPPNGVTGWRGRYTTPSDLTAKGMNWSGNIALRLPPDVIGIDIDVYHGGNNGLAELVERFGELPETTYSTSRTDGSGIALFRVPVGTVLATDPAEGIDLIQAHHRYVVCAPSIHPDGRRYGWIDDQAEEQVDGPPEPGELPELPWPWIEGLAMDKTAGVNAVTPDTAQTFVTAHTERTRPGALDGIRTHLKTVRPGGRHDALVSTMCWAMREAAAGLYTADEAIATIHAWWIDAVSDQPHRRDNGEFGGTILWAIGQTANDTQRIQQIRDSTDLTTLIAPTSNGHRPSNVNPDTGEIITAGLDDTFWNSRPYLAHIHQAARSRLVAPHAVLGAILARTAAFTPPSSCLPPIVGTTSPLSIYVALRGASGAGKSAPASTAADLIPITPPGVVGPWALGTGEGLAEAFMELVDDPSDDSKKPRKIKRQVHHGALFTLDEGQVLAEIGSRKGATILPVLRTAWSGGDPGQANASLETRRSLKPGTYHVGLISLWQDFAAANLIADAPGGTPQRFIWFATNDPDATLNTPEWPGPLNWQPPPYIVIAGSHAHHPLDIHPDIEHEIRMARVNVLNGTSILDNLDAHRRLAKLRVAAILAILDNRHDINPEDWQLAGQIIDTSDQIRNWIIDENRRHAGDLEMSGHRRAATREIIVATEIERTALSGAAKAIAKRVHRDNGEPVGRAALGHAIAGRHRKIVTTDDAIEEAERLHWITPKGDLGWTPGEAKPT